MAELFPVMRHDKPMCGRSVMSKATGDLLSYLDAKEVKGQDAGLLRPVA